MPADIRIPNFRVRLMLILHLIRFLVVGFVLFQCQQFRLSPSLQLSFNWILLDAAFFYLQIVLARAANWIVSFDGWRFG